MPDLRWLVLCATLLLAIGWEMRANARLRAELEQEPRVETRTVIQRVAGPIRIIKQPVRVVETVLQECPPCGHEGLRPLGGAPRRVVQRTVERGAVELDRGEVKTTTDKSAETAAAPAEPPRDRFVGAGYGLDGRFEVFAGLTVWKRVDLAAGAAFGREVYPKATAAWRF